eukprot:TRINITY_DN220_c0_g1_i1.p1 TRINITY_DN220_c0_g1~~TRINITY_DN220_c0_g1_i1.p1  ORF type:complete len:1128 (-),score=439.15 TRINITY_DN220_c0_g1_i1:128-3511(-)
MVNVEIEKGVGDWLVKANVFGHVIPRRSRNNPDTHIEFDTKVSESLNDGTAICRLLHHLDPNNNKLPSLSLLKASSSPADRLHNWNILAKALTVFKIRLDSDMKKLIVNGDVDVVLELLSELKQKSANGKPQNNGSSRAAPAAASNDAQVSLDLKFLENCREVEQASNALEFLVIVMIVKLGLHAKQAAALLTANTKYLTHMLEKGVSGKFDFAAPFYSFILQHAPLLAQHLHQNTATIPFTLNLLSAAFNSAHEESAQWMCRIFVRLAAELSTLGHGSMLPTWLAQPKEHLVSLLGCYSRHAEAHDAVVLVLLEMGQSQLPEILSKQAGTVLSAPEFAGLVVATLSTLQQQKKRQVDPAAVAPGLVSAAVRKAIECPDAADRLGCLRELLRLFQHKTARASVVDNSAAVKAVLDLLKKTGRDDQGTVAMQGQFELFDAVAAGAKGGVSAATSVAVWKALMFGLFERRPGDEALRALTSGVADRLNGHKELAVSLIVDPLSKQIAVHGTAHLDFNFLAAVGKHPKLSSSQARTFLEVLAKVFADGDDKASQAVAPVLVALIQRYQSDNSTVNACNRVVQEALTTLQPQSNASPQRQVLVVSTLDQIASFSRQHADVVRSGIQQQLQLTSQNSALRTLYEKLGGSLDGGSPAAVEVTQQSKGKPEPPVSNKGSNPRNKSPARAPAAAVEKLGPRARKEKEQEEQRLKDLEARRKNDPAFVAEEEDQAAKKKAQALALLEQRKRREQEIKDIIANKKKKLDDAKEAEKNKRAKSAEAKNRLTKARQRDRARFLAKKAERAKEDEDEATKAANDPSRSVVASAPSQLHGGGSPNRRIVRAQPFWEDQKGAHINHVIQKYPHNKRQDVKEVADMVYDIIQLAIHGPKPPHIEPPKDNTERQRRIAKFNNPDPSRALLTKLEANSEQLSPEHKDMLQDERKRLARAEQLHVKLAEYSKEKKQEEVRLKEAERVYEEIKQNKIKEKEARERARREAEKAKVLEWRRQRDTELLTAKQAEERKKKIAGKEKQRLNIDYMNKKAERQGKKVQVEKIEHDDEPDTEAKKKAALEKKKREKAKKRAEEKKAKAAAEVEANVQQEVAKPDEDEGYTPPQKEEEAPEPESQPELSLIHI